MYSSIFSVLSSLLLFNFFLLTSAKCPTVMPTEINGRCYNFETKVLSSFKDARDNCPKKDELATIASVRSQVVMDKIREMAKEYVDDKLKNNIFWMGLFMEDTDRQKAAKDRDWKWPYDKTKIVQKEYEWWEKEGGPTNKGLACSAITPKNNYMVKPVDCSGPRIPVICMMKEGDPCTSDTVPYMMFGSYCVGSNPGTLPYDKMRGACTPGVPTAYRTEMRKAVMTAAKSVFLGGGIFMNIQRDTDGKFRDLSDNWEPDDDWWDEGEPGSEYDCAGLVFMDDWSLKLKTMNCKFLASYLCILNANSTVDIK